MLVAIGENNQRILAKNASKTNVCVSTLSIRSRVSTWRESHSHFAHKVKGSRPCYKTKRMNIIKQKYY